MSVKNKSSQMPTISEVPKFISEFRERMAVFQKESGMNDRAFAAEIGVEYTTYRNWMGRVEGRGSGDGPTLKTIRALYAHLSTEKATWLLTGQISPTHGDQDTEGVLHLRRKDDPQSAETRELLDLARKVLKSDDDLAKKALTESIRALSRPVKADNPIKKRARRQSA